MTVYNYLTTEPKPTTTEWSLISNARAFSSPLTGATQTIGRAGERWKITMTCENLNDDDRGRVVGFFARLNGAEHRFTMYDHAYVRRGALGGTPIINGANQTGNSLVIDGCSNSVPGYLKAGDWISFSTTGELKMVTADCDSDGSGNCTIPIIPKIRVSPTDNAAIVTGTTRGQFILMTDNLTWTYAPTFSKATNSSGSNITIEAVEDIV